MDDGTLAAPGATPRPAPPEGLADTLETLERPPRASWLPLFVLSLAAFVFLQSGDHGSPLRQVTVVAGVLLFHELGHVVAMRLLGWRDVRVFFIPFFGALTTARARPASRVREALVSLAGPLPGIAIAPFLLLGPLRASPLAREIGFTALAVNAFNLLPIGFLDGGRVLDRLLFQRHRVLETGFAALSAVAFFALGVAMGAWVFGVLGAITLVAVPLAWRRGREAARLRGRLDPADGDLRALPEPQLRALYGAALTTAGPRSRPAARAETMRELFSRATTPHASALACAGFGAAWLLALVASLGIAAVALDRGPAIWRTVSHEAGFTVELPATPLYADAKTVVARHGDVEFAAFSYPSRGLPRGASPELQALARRMAPALGGEIVQEGPASSDPEGWRVRIRVADGTEGVFEVHPSADSYHLLFATAKARHPAPAADVERFLASYAAAR